MDWSGSPRSYVSGRVIVGAVVLVLLAVLVYRNRVWIGARLRRWSR